CFYILKSYRAQQDLLSFPTRRSSDLIAETVESHFWDERTLAFPSYIWLSDSFLCPYSYDVEMAWLMQAQRLSISRNFGNSSKFQDRKSTRLNSSHDQISYAVFCLKKK